jgi:CRP-like cAMP-binding protein
MLDDILKTVGKFSQEELNLFEKHLIKNNFKKNEILLNEGVICNKAWFILSGAVYQFRYDDIDENVFDLHCENDWFVGHSSFVTQKPSNTIIKAYSDCEVLEINVDSIHQLIAQSPSFLQLGKILDTAVSRAHYFDNPLTPHEKYDYLMKTRPQLLQKFPLTIIASYLKITRETLSRVRSAY